jgi:hypothetical protein
VQPSVKYIKVGKIGTKDTIIRHQLGVFELRSGPHFKPPFYCRGFYRHYSQPGQNISWRLWDSDMKTTVLESYRIARQFGAELVRVKTPESADELYGVLWIGDVPASLSGAKAQSYYIELPDRYVREAQGGRVSVVFERVGEGENSTLGWALWMSDVPFALPQTKMGLGLRLSYASPGHVEWAYPGSSAAAAGIQRGDRITHVGGRATRDWSMEQIERAIDAAGAVVTLTVARPGQETTRIQLRKTIFKY